MYLSPLFLFATAMFLGSSLIANAYGLVQPALREDIGLSPTLAGALFSIYSLCVAAGSWGAGRVAGRVAGPTLLRSGLVLSFGGHVTMLATGHPAGAFVGFALIGFGQGQAMATVSAAVSARFAGRRSQALSILEIAFSAAAVATPALVAALGGWRAPYAASAAFLALLIALSLLPRTLPTDASAATAERSGFTPSGTGDARLRLGFAVCFLVSGVEWIGSVWLPTFVSANAQLTGADAAWAMSLLWSGFVASRIGGALLFARIDVDRALVVAAVVAALGALAAVLADTRVVLFAGTALLGLGTGCLFPGLLGQMVDRDPVHAASITGTAIALTAGAGVVLPFALGALADAVGLRSASLLLPATALAALAALVASRAVASRACCPQPA